MIHHFLRLAVITCVLAAPANTQLHAAPRGDGQLRVELFDADTGQPIAGRMHLKNSRGRPVKLNFAGAAEYADHFYIDGQSKLPLRRGQYTFELDAGPEYRPQSGHFEIERHADDTKRIEMKRFANLAEEGWWGSDLDVTPREQDLPLILRAEGLAVVGIAKLGLRFADDSAESEIRNPQSEIARVPYAWNLPVWLARDELAAIQLIHHHSLRKGVVDNEDDGRPRDRSLFSTRAGNGQWSEHVYYHVLNCGLRVPPAAGSGTGTNDNPAGTNRVYVHCGEEFSEDAWREGLLAGHVFVTNGPLLRTRVDGQPPGYVFRLESGDSVSFEIGLDLATREPIEYLQIIKNGQSEAEVRLDEWKNRKGRLPAISFDESGWFLVRAVTSNLATYQFASSGPYYVEQAGQPRISRRSVEFFLDWIAAAEARIREMPGQDDAARASLLAEQRLARQFFHGLLADANAE